MKGSIMLVAGLILGLVMSRFSDLHILVELAIALMIGLCILGVMKLCSSEKQSEKQNDTHL